jgi:hypothetical protein
LFRLFFAINSIYEVVDVIGFPVFAYFSRACFIDGEVTGDIQHPRKQPPFRSIVGFHPVPDAQKSILEHFFGNVFIVYDA